METLLFGSGPPFSLQITLVGRNQCWRPTDVSLPGIHVGCRSTNVGWPDINVGWRPTNVVYRSTASPKTSFEHWLGWGVRQRGSQRLPHKKSDQLNNPTVRATTTAVIARDMPTHQVGARFQGVKDQRKPSREDVTATSQGPQKCPYLGIRLASL